MQTLEELRVEQREKNYPLLLFKWNSLSEVQARHTAFVTKYDSLKEKITELRTQIGAAQEARDACTEELIMKGKRLVAKLFLLKKKIAKSEQVVGDAQAEWVNLETAYKAFAKRIDMMDANVREHVQAQKEAEEMLAVIVKGENQTASS